MRKLFFIFFLFSLAAGAQPQNRYLMYTGTIGTYPVTMHLHKKGHVYNGYYYYEKRQEPVGILGEDTTVAGTISLMATRGGADESFRFVLQGNSANGTWRLSEKNAPLPFKARLLAQEPFFDLVSFDSATLLRPGMTRSPAAAFDAAVVWPRAGAKASTAVQKKVHDFVCENCPAEAPNTLLQKAAAAYFAAYRKEFEAEKEATIKEMPSVYTNDQTKSAMIAYRDDRFISIAFFEYAYTGGAHGIYGTSFGSFDLLSGNALKLSDVLNTAGIQALPRLLAAAFRQQKGLRFNAPLTDGGLFENKIKRTENFFVTGKKLGFNYVPYEIGPYAMGETTIYLSYESIKQYLRPEFVKGWKKNQGCCK